MTTSTDKTDAEQIKQVQDLARQGCTINEVAAALSFTEAEKAAALEDEEHPLSKAYWTARHAYTQRLRAVAMNIAENSTDESVRAKMVEFLVKENQELLMDKKFASGHTNIRKLLSIIREQFATKKEKVAGPVIGSHGTRGSAARPRRSKALLKEASDAPNGKSGGNDGDG